MASLVYGARRVLEEAGLDDIHFHRIDTLGEDDPAIDSLLQAVNRLVTTHRRALDQVSTLRKTIEGMAIVITDEDV